MNNRNLNRANLFFIKQLCFAYVFLNPLVLARHIEHDVIRQKMEQKELPRKVLVDALQNGQYFQDIFSEHLAPLKIEFGHVCENPKEWEQRFERRDMENNQHQGKVRWGNKNGEYGEHYWDLNHGAI